MVNAFFYTNTAVATTLSGSINNAVTTCVVVSTTGWPSSFPFVVALDYGGASEELVRVTANAAGTLTIVRAFGGTTAVSHSAGAVVRHIYNAQDATDFRTHEQGTTGVHGVTGAVVGTTDTQTLSAKTLTSPTINNATMASGGSFAGTYTGAPTFSGNPTFSGTPVFSTGISMSAVISGTPNFTGSVTLGGGGALSGTFTSSPATFSGAPTFTGGPLFNAVAPRLQQTTTTTTALGVRTIGTDTQDRLQVQAGGTLLWGSGSAVGDVTLLRDSADVLRTNDSLIVDGNLTVSGNFAGPSGIGRMLRARKLGDTARNTTTTPTDDPELVIAMTASTVYELEGVLFISSTSVTPDFKLGINGPASSAGWWSSVGPSVSSTSDPDAVRTIASDIGSVTTRSYGIPTTSTIYGLHIMGMVETAGTAGNLAIQWSQATSNATDVNLKIYSWIRLIRLT